MYIENKRPASRVSKSDWLALFVFLLMAGGLYYGLNAVNETARAEEMLHEAWPSPEQQPKIDRAEAAARHCLSRVMSQALFTPDGQVRSRRDLPSGKELAMSEGMCGVEFQEDLPPNLRRSFWAATRWKLIEAEKGW
jgi:hypothetical protein